MNTTFEYSPVPIKLIVTVKTSDSGPSEKGTQYKRPHINIQGTLQLEVPKNYLPYSLQPLRRGQPLYKGQN